MSHKLCYMLYIFSTLDIQLIILEIIYCELRTSAMISSVISLSYWMLYKVWSNHIFSLEAAILMSVMEQLLNCTQADRFQKLTTVKSPMLLQFWTNSSMRLEECEVECLKDCFCNTYANSLINGGSHGCMLWFGDLIDIRLLISEDSAQLDL